MDAVALRPGVFFQLSIELCVIPAWVATHVLIVTLASDRSERPLMPLSGRPIMRMSRSFRCRWHRPDIFVVPQLRLSLVWLIASLGLHRSTRVEPAVPSTP